MKKNTESRPAVSRRRFLSQVALAVPAGAVLLDVVANTSLAADAALPKLEESDPSAKALLYVHDHTKVDKANPMAARYAPDQQCHNCSQIQGKDGEEWRPCAIFPGKSVHANGWCSVWAKKV